MRYLSCCSLNILHRGLHCVCSCVLFAYTWFLLKCLLFLTRNERDIDGLCHSEQDKKIKNNRPDHSSRVVAIFIKPRNRIRFGEQWTLEYWFLWSLVGRVVLYGYVSKIRRKTRPREYFLLTLASWEIYLNFFLIFLGIFNWFARFVACGCPRIEEAMFWRHNDKECLIVCCGMVDGATRRTAGEQRVAVRPSRWCKRAVSSEQWEWRREALTASATHLGNTRSSLAYQAVRRVPDPGSPPAAQHRYTRPAS